MTVHDLHRPSLIAVGGARTGETSPPSVLDHVCVGTRNDWPQAEFVAWLDGVRRQLGLPSDYQLARHLGISHTLISGWRGGRQQPSMQTLSSMAAVLEEDPRRLWVLAGHANAIDVGLLDDDATPRMPAPELPDEIVDLIQVYGDERMTDDDRSAVRGWVATLVRGIRADLNERAKKTTRVQRAS